MEYTYIPTGIKRELARFGVDCNGKGFPLFSIFKLRSIIFLFILVFHVIVLFYCHLSFAYNIMGLSVVSQITIFCKFEIII